MRRNGQWLFAAAFVVAIDTGENIITMFFPVFVEPVFC
jgi:hypothetical protein